MSFDPSKYSDASLKQQEIKHISGAYICRIKECYFEKSDKEDKHWERITLIVNPLKRFNTKFTELKQKPESMQNVIIREKEIDGKKSRIPCKVENSLIDMPDTTKEYKFQMLVVGNDGKDTYEAKKIASMFRIIMPDAKFTIKKRKVPIWKDGGWQDVEMPSYSEFIGKEIGIMMLFSRTFPLGTYDGYTGQQLFDASEIKGNKNAIRLKNYNADLSINFRVAHFFNPETHQTFTELADKAEPKEVYNFVDKSYDMEDKKPSPEKIDEERMEELKKLLAKNKVKFNKALFRSEYIGNDTSFDTAKLSSGVDDEFAGLTSEDLDL